MRPLSGRRINRINLEPIKGNSSKILQPFVFGDALEPVVYPILSIDSDKWGSKIIIGIGNTKLRIIV